MRPVWTRFFSIFSIYQDNDGQPKCGKNWLQKEEPMLSSLVPIIRISGPLSTSMGGFMFKSRLYFNSLPHIRRWIEERKVASYWRTWVPAAAITGVAEGESTQAVIGNLEQHLALKSHNFACVVCALCLRRNSVIEYKFSPRSILRPFLYRSPSN